jgi:GT2 family glycosyltransferase
MDVSIIIPNWNGRLLLEKNLPKVLDASKNKSNNIVEVIVVDDGSTDDSVKFLETNFKKRIRLIKQKNNRGFSATVNHGVELAKGDLVCLLNTDVIPSINFLEKISTHFEDKKIFAVSLHEQGFGYAKGKFVNGFIAHDPGKEESKPTSSFWASGGSAVFSKKLWDKLGGFDVRLLTPFYWEDVDLCYRALKRGYKVYWEPKAKVVHAHESVINSTNFRKWKLDLIKERNYLLFNWKNITSKNLLNKHFKGLFTRITKHPGYLKVVLFALIKLPQTLKMRKIEKKEAIVSDEAIFESFKI